MKMLPLRLRLNIANLIAVATIALLGHCAVAQTPSATPSPKGSGSLSGVWTLTGYKGSGRYTARERAQQTTDGKLPPLLPWAKDLLEKRIVANDKGTPFATTLSQCLPGGVPLMVVAEASYPIQILETPGQVTMLFEEQNHFRTIFLNEKHPADPDPTYMGHSVGKWEGDTLVVDTVGLTDRTTIDQIGMPHSEDLHVIEKYRRLDGTTMEVVATIDDPKTFSQPWNTKAVYKLSPPGSHINEYICENNRNSADANGFTTFEQPASSK